MPLDVGDVCVVGAAEGGGYWSREPVSATMAPTQFFPYGIAVQEQPMRILSRSRDGKRRVCSSSSPDCQLLVCLDAQEAWLVQKNVLPYGVSSLIITDHTPTELQSVVLTTPGLEDIFLDVPAEEHVTLAVPPDSLLFETPGGLVGLCRFDDPLKIQWLPSGGVEAQAFGCYIKRHAQMRISEVTGVFETCPYPIHMPPADFVLAFRTDPLVFPSVFATIKLNGRPSFSLDKGPRVVRSPSLTEEEEMEVSAAPLAPRAAPSLMRAAAGRASLLSSSSSKSCTSISPSISGASICRPRPSSCRPISAGALFESGTVCSLRDDRPALQEPLRQAHGAQRHCVPAAALAAFLQGPGSLLLWPPTCLQAHAAAACRVQAQVGSEARAAAAGHGG